MGCMHVMAAVASSREPAAEASLSCVRATECAKWPRVPVLRVKPAGSGSA